MVTYGSDKKAARREAGHIFGIRSAELSCIVDLVHQDALSMSSFDCVKNLTDVQVCISLDKVVRVKRVAE